MMFALQRNGLTIRFPECVPIVNVMQDRNPPRQKGPTGKTLYQPRNFNWQPLQQSETPVQ